MASITKHHSKQERKGDHGIGCYGTRANNSPKTSKSHTRWHTVAETTCGKTIEQTSHLLLTWVDLLVGSNTIRIHNGLKAFGELVGLVVGWRRLMCGDAVQDGRHRGSTSLLNSMNNR